MHALLDLSHPQKLMQMKSYSVTQDIQQTRAKHCDKEGAAYRPYSWTPPLKKPQALAALSWDFLGGPGLRNWLAVQAMLVLSLVRELRYHVLWSNKACMPQLESPSTTTKTPCNKINQSINTKRKDPYDP